MFEQQCKFMIKFGFVSVLSSQFITSVRSTGESKLMSVIRNVTAEHTLVDRKVREICEETK